MEEAEGGVKITSVRIGDDADKLTFDPPRGPQIEVDWADSRPDRMYVDPPRSRAVESDFTPLGTTLCPSSDDAEDRGATAKEHRQIKNALKRLRKKRRGPPPKAEVRYFEVRTLRIESIDGTAFKRAGKE